MKINKWLWRLWNNRFIEGINPGLQSMWSQRVRSDLLFSHQVVSDSLHPMDCSTPGFLVPHHLPEFAQIHVHWIGDGFQLSHHCRPLLLLPSIFPTSGSFPLSQLFASGGQKYWSFNFSISHSWFPLRLTSLISLLSKGLSRVFSSTTVWKRQFFSTLLSSLSSSHICTWLLERL